MSSLSPTIDLDAMTNKELEDLHEKIESILTIRKWHLADVGRILNNSWYFVEESFDEIVENLKLCSFTTRKMLFHSIRVICHNLNKHIVATSATLIYIDNPSCNDYPNKTMQVVYTLSNNETISAAHMEYSSSRNIYQEINLVYKDCSILIGGSEYAMPKSGLDHVSLLEVCGLDDDPLHIFTLYLYLCEPTFRFCVPSSKLLPTLYFLANKK